MALMYRAPNLEVPASDPFKNDLLGRSGAAEALTDLALTTKHSLVVGLDAEWGQGKTTFLRMWRQHLEKAGVTSIYFDAWKSDFSGNALVAMMGELGLEMGVGGAGGKIGQALTNLKKVGVGLAKRSIPVVVKLATAGIVDVSQVVDDAAASVAEGLAEDSIASYEASRKSMEAFREALAKFAAAVTEKSTNGAPLVFVIDELDRCKPDYALEVMETVKHLFSVDGVFFLIAADWGQLANIVRTRYGVTVDVAGYLRRFVDIHYNLPPIESKKFSTAQFERFGLQPFFNGRTNSSTRFDRKQIEEVLDVLFESTACSLRDREHCFSLVVLATKATPPDKLLHGVLLAALVVLKVKNPVLYQRFAMRAVDYKELVSYFSKSPMGKSYLSGDGDGEYGDVLFVYLMSVSVPDRERLAAVAQFRSGGSMFGLGTNRSDRLLPILSDRDFRSCDRLLGYLTQKIDLANAGV